MRNGSMGAASIAGMALDPHAILARLSLEDGEGRINISEIDFLPRREKPWPLRKDPWSDGFPFVSPVDQYGEKSRNGFGLADMCGGVWELVIDHFDLKGSQRLARRSRIALRGRGKRETSSPLAERK